MQKNKITTSTVQVIYNLNPTNRHLWSGNPNALLDPQTKTPLQYLHRDVEVLSS